MARRSSRAVERAVTLEERDVLLAALFELRLTRQRSTATGRRTHPVRAHVSRRRSSPWSMSLAVNAVPRCSARSAMSGAISTRRHLNNPADDTDR
jgi:hypothetical protein